jgi:spectinomycin phosphotransferase
MLEKPNLQDEKIITCLQDQFGMQTVQVVFLPLGADQNTAVYRAEAVDGKVYFVKLRSGDFKETSVTLPKFLHDQDISQIIPPLLTQNGQLWASLDPFKVILYPFVEGLNGYELILSPRQWRDFGAALKRVHASLLPETLRSRIPQETFSPQWRDMVRLFLQRVEEDVFPEPIADQLAVFLQSKSEDILDLVEHAERYAQILQRQSLEFTLCHSDVHAGNILVDANGALYIVDWDDPILAPKERDLMFIGGAQGFSGYTVQEEAALFYQGYGPTQIDSIALAYYRYERILVDIAVYCQQLLLTDEGGDDRQQSLRYLKSNFLPNNTIEIAYRSDLSLHQRRRKQ